jgi:hypothetical protein
MNPLFLVLREIKVLSSGFGGGFIYLFGRADFAPHGTVDTYAYFPDLDKENKTEESVFRTTYAGGDLIVSSDSWQYLPSTGLSLNHIKWENTKPSGSANFASAGG